MRLRIGVGLVLVAGILMAGCRQDAGAPKSVSASSVTQAVTLAAPAGQAGGQPTVNHTPTATQTPEPTIIPSTATSTPTPIPTELALTPTSTPCGQLLCLYQGHLIFSRPIGEEGNTEVDPTYRYGSTQGGERRIHHGVELLNPMGTPVLAAADGVVAVAGTDADHHYANWYNHYGNLVVIEHDVPGIDEPVYTLYAHLSEILTEEGAIVRAGDVIGEVGFTGRATGNHLHFEVRVGENEYSATRNPALWWAPDESPGGVLTGVLAGSIRTEKGDPWYIPELTIEQLGADDETVSETIYIETYADETVNGDDILDEDFAIGDLAPGTYRIKFVANGLQSHVVQVLPGKITFFNFQAESEGE